GGGLSWARGCCLGRLFGWTSNYAPTYAVSYAPVCSTCASPCSTCSTCASPCSTCSTCAAPCSSCSSCTSCGYSPCSSCTQTVTMQPACSCGSSCGCSDCGSSGCSSCGSTAVVGQAVYQQSSGCSSCGQAQAVVAAPTATVMPMNTQPAPPASTSQPELAPSEQVGPRTFQKPANGGAEMQPTPVGQPSGTAPTNGPGATTEPSANYF